MSLLAIVPYPRGFLLTRQRNTWSCLYFKWVALRFHSPVGGQWGLRRLHFCFSVFPPNLGKVHSVPADRHWKPNTTSPINPNSLDHSTQGGLSYRSQVCSNMDLKVLPHVYISVSTTGYYCCLTDGQAYRTANHWFAFPKVTTLCFPETSTATMACVQWRVSSVAHSCLRLCWHPKLFLRIIYCSHADV